MDPITLLVAGGAIALVGVAVLAFWEDIVNWARDSLFPWFRKHLPTLAPYLESGFSVVNKLAGAARKVAVQAWRRLRPQLLGLVETFERRGSTYFLKVTSYLRKSLAEPEVQRTETSQTLSLHDLPPDVQEAFLKGQTSFDLNVTQQQDFEMEKAALELGMAI